MGVKSLILSRETSGGEVFSEYTPFSAVGIGMVGREGPLSPCIFLSFTHFGSVPLFITVLRMMSGCVFLWSLHPSFETTFPIELEACWLARLTVHQVPCLSVSFTKCWRYWTILPRPYFYMYAGYLNSYLHPWSLSKHFTYWATSPVLWMISKAQINRQ